MIKVSTKLRIEKKMACQDFMQLYKLEPGQIFYKYRINEVFCEEINDQVEIKLFMTQVKNTSVGFYDYLVAYSDLNLVQYKKVSDQETLVLGFISVGETELERGRTPGEVSVTLYGKILEVLQN